MSIISVPFFIGEPMPGFDVPEPHVTLDPELPADRATERMSV
jgi:hypothetical protein